MGSIFGNSGQNTEFAQWYAKAKAEYEAKKAREKSETQRQRLQNQAEQGSDPNFIGPDPKWYADAVSGYKQDRQTAKLASETLSQGQGPRALQVKVPGSSFLQAAEQLTAKPQTVPNLYSMSRQQREEYAKQGAEDIAAMLNPPRTTPLDELRADGREAVKPGMYTASKAIQGMGNSVAGMVGAAEAVKDYAQYLQNGRQAPEPMPRLDGRPNALDVYRDWTDFNTALSQAEQQYVSPLRRTYGTVVQGVTGMAIPMATAPLTGGMGLVTGISAGGNAAMDAKLQGYNPEQSLARGVMTGVVQGGLTSKITDKYLPFRTQSQAGNAIKRFLQNQGKLMLAEGTEESIEDAAQLGIDYLSLNQKPTWEDLQNLPKQMLDSFVAGALTAGVIGLPGNISNARVPGWAQRYRTSEEGTATEGLNNRDTAGPRLEAYRDTPLQESQNRGILNPMEVTRDGQGTTEGMGNTVYNPGIRGQMGRNDTGGERTGQAGNRATEQNDAGRMGSALESIRGEEIGRGQEAGAGKGTWTTQSGKQLTYQPVQENQLGQAQHEARSRANGRGFDVVYFDGELDAYNADGTLFRRVDDGTVDGNAIFVRRDSAYPASNVVDHESVHGIKRLQPEAYDTLWDTVQNAIYPVEFDNEVESFGKLVKEAYGERYTEEQLYDIAKEETLANLSYQINEDTPPSYVADVDAVKQAYNVFFRALSTSASDSDARVGNGAYATGVREAEPQAMGERERRTARALGTKVSQQGNTQQAAEMDTGTGDVRSQSPNTANPVLIYETDTEPVKAAKQVMNLLSDRYGVQYEMKQMDADINGYYDGNTQKIYINENAKDPLLNVVAHEFLHAFKDMDAEGYRTLRNITESDFHLARFQEYKQKTLEAWDKAGLTNYKNRSDAEINDMVIEEAMSDLMGEIMRDPTTIERIATADRNLAQRIIDYLGQIIERIKQYFKGENKEIRDLVEHYEQVKEIYQEVVSQSDGQMRKTTGNTGQQYSFAGKNAQQADMSALQRAQQMKADGAGAEDILRETGWFTGLDGQWRFELDDSQMKIDYDGIQQKHAAWLEGAIERLRAQEPGKTYAEAKEQVLADEKMPLTLIDVLDYPELYRQYPDMADIPVYLYSGEEGYAGSYNPDTDEMVLTQAGMNHWRRTLPHEIQHAIQVREGFDMGFPTEGRPTDAQYWDSAGEIEAREAGRRQGMTAQERRESLPMKDVQHAVLSDGSETGPRYAIKTDRDGRPTVVIEEDIFAGHEGEKPHKVIRDYIKNHYTGDFARIIESGQKVYFGKDLPGEYVYSKAARNLNLERANAKNQAAQDLKGLLEIGTNRRWNKNVKDKHNVDAKYGWYKYATRFQVNGKTYDADVLIRNDANGKKYLYDVMEPKEKGRGIASLPTDNGSGIGSTLPSSVTDSIPQDGETVNTSIRNGGDENTKYSVFRKNSRGQKATEAMQLYEQSGNAAHLPDVSWAKQYQRDSEKREKYLENQISTAEFEAENAKTPEQQERLRKLIDNLRAKQAETMRDIETSGALMDAIDSETVERNYDLAAIADDLKDVDKGLKIKSGNYRFNDVYRNFERVFGEHFDVVRPLLESFDSAKGDYAHDAVGTAQELYSYIVKGLGIKPGSKESKAIQWIAEGERTPNLKNAGDMAALKEMGEDIEHLKPDVKVPYTKEQLYREFGKEKADNIVKAEGWFREQYDRLINEINRTRRRIYPNNPDKLIPKRKDYMRHFRELRDGVLGLVDILRQDNNITPNLAGISEFTQPKKKWASIDQQRKGNVTDEGAIEGFLDYLPQAEYAVYIDPYIDRFRSLGRDLAQLKTDAGKSDLNSFIAYLGDFANDLAGKTSGIDRVILKSMGSNGRTMLRALGWLNNRTKANAVMANAGSIAKQVMNLPNGMMYMQNPVGSMLRGIVDVAKGLDKDSKVSQNYKKSGFLTERFMDKAFQKFERMSVGRAAGSLLGMADEFGTRAIWNGLYHEAVQNGEPDPAAYADRLTRKAVAGRGIGELPLAYKTQVGKLVLPFQVEVNNTWNVLRDTIQGKTPKGKLPDYGNRVMKTLVWMLATWALGAALEEAVGSKGGFDPLGDIIDGWQQGYSEQPEAGKLQKAGRAAKRAVQNLAGDFIGSRSFGWMAAELMDAIDSDWSDRFFNGSIFPSQGVNVPALQSLTKTVKKASSGDLVGALAEVGTSFVTPFGGKQLDKTIRGLGDVKRGGGYQNNIYEELSTGERGDQLYELDDSVWNAIRAGAFGPSALQENAAYWDEQRANTISSTDRRKQEQKATDAFIREYRKNNKNSEVVRLYNETKNKEVFPFEPIDRERKFTEKKQPYQFTLTKEQADTYQELQNEEMQKAYDKVMQTPEYKNADTEGKKTLLKEARSEAKSKVSAQIKKDYLKEVGK